MMLWLAGWLVVVVASDAEPIIKQSSIDRFGIIYKIVVSAAIIRYSSPRLACSLTVNSMAKALTLTRR